jgi:type I restriction enzyme R subunit
MEGGQVKKVAKELLAKLRSVLTLDWQKTQQSRARVQDTIEQSLDEGLPRAYTPELFKSKSGLELGGMN